MLREIAQALNTFRASAERTIEFDDFETQVTALLSGKVFHVTAAHHLPQIVAARAILPNADGRFTSPFSQSSNSYGVKRNYVCLFDFRAHNNELISTAFECFLWSAIRKYAHRPTFLVLDAAAHEALIDSQTAQRETGGREVWIPYVECWYPKPLATNEVAEAICLRVHHKPFDGSIAAQHARVVERLWRKRRFEAQKRDAPASTSE